ncbi:uncharacterized protein BP5553_01669 [Venustampulla echinocandica]|uniref:Ubiquitin-like domain-containing protein n=1 Tax=Venustampulla echinocandica TaxID=2656787 RepID=A0A370U1N5_9HELO|nr:uncharacterized protein BP5553_01669 [Venustampulla echinocandica]RDL41690.1 hypothetical protein BP5553_01669 [Venustampulla echinocandica]
METGGAEQHSFTAPNSMELDLDLVAERQPPEHAMHSTASRGRPRLGNAPPSHDSHRPAIAWLSFSGCKLDSPSEDFLHHTKYGVLLISRNPPKDCAVDHHAEACGKIRGRSTDGEPGNRETERQAGIHGNAMIATGFLAVELPRIDISFPASLPFPTRGGLTAPSRDFASKNIWIALWKRKSASLCWCSTPHILIRYHRVYQVMRKNEELSGKVMWKGSATAMPDSWKKMGWVLFKKEELKALRDNLHVKLSNISVLIATANYERMPSHVAQYQDTPTLNTPPPPSYTHLAEEQPECFPNNIASTSTAVRGAPRAAKPSELDARFARLEEMMAQQRLAQMLLDQQRKSDSAVTKEAGEQPIPDFEVNEDEIHEESQGSEFEPESEPQPSCLPLPSEVIELFTRFEVFIKAQRRKECYDLELISDLERVVDKYMSNNKVYKPIRFKDVVGRKFSFPFHLAQTWAGMEELIKQAFVHVDVIGTHVASGQYDLLGPNGERIRPSAWESVIQPDWSITMLLWPMVEPTHYGPHNPPLLPPPPPLVW